LTRSNDDDVRSKRRGPSGVWAAVAGALLLSGCLPTQYSDCSDPAALAAVRQTLARPMDVAKVLADGERGMGHAFGAYSALVSSPQTSFSSIRTVAYDGAARRSNCVAVMEIPLPQAVRTALKGSDLQALLTRAGVADGLSSIPMEVGYVVHTNDHQRQLRVEIVNGEDVLRRLIFIVAAQAAFEIETTRSQGRAERPVAIEVL
jgi:hypothetical protein